MQTSTTEWGEQLKAAAIAFRRANRAPWQNAHADRVHREREARRVSKEYREAQRVAEGTKPCTSCGQALPLDQFSPSFRDRPTARCKPCSAAATRARYHADLTKARNRTRNRPVDPERERKAAERERRASERLQRLSDDRQRKTDERRRLAAERIAQLSALLRGTAEGPRISSEEQWDVTTSELHRLWLQTGDKECVSCKAIVPPTAILPPGPANFYPGKCHSCAEADVRENTLKVTGRPCEPALVPLLDGTSITLAEFARRHREREQGYRRA